MRAPLSTQRFQRLAGSSAIFLAYCGIVRGLRSEFNLTDGVPGSVILVGYPDFPEDIYRLAFEYFLFGKSDGFREQSASPRALYVIDENPRHRKSDHVDVAKLFGKYVSVFILTPSLDAVPAPIRVGAEAIIHIERPTSRHLQAARRLAGRDAMPTDIVAALEGHGADFAAPFIGRRSYRSTDAETIHKLKRSNGAANDGPDLGSLPGYGELKPWALSVASDVARWKQGLLSWSEVDRGVLLSGPPGTGKTLFARAFANTCNLPLIATSVATWQSHGHLGDTLNAMRATFANAKASGASIVFLDELDSIGDRESFTGESATYMRQVVNGLLECIDGTQGRDGTIVVGATNFPDAIDKALRRSGRLERHIKIGLPTATERAEILAHHLGRRDMLNMLFKLSGDTHGWSGADLEMFAREAKRQSRNLQRELVFEDIIGILPRETILSDEMLWRVAVHECGHAIVSHSIGQDRPVGMAIRKRYRAASGGMGAHGYTRYGMDDKPHSSTQQILDLICRDLGGTAAEDVMLGQRSTGAGGTEGSDLETASRLACQVVCSYGMGNNIGYLASSASAANFRLLDLPASVLREMAEIQNEQYARARGILVARTSVVERLAKALLNKDELNEKEINDVIEASSNDVVPNSWLRSTYGRLRAGIVGSSSNR